MNRKSIQKKRASVLVIHGPNLNLLGTREPDKYGNITLDEINNNIRLRADELDIDVKIFQSNIEGEIVNSIQEAIGSVDGIVINAAGYTHTSVAIRDALLAVNIPTVEVHISNIHAREEFRHHSFIAPVCIGQIAGFGINSYLLAMDALIAAIKKM